MICTTAVVLALLALVPQNRSKLEALVGEPALAHGSITTSHDGPSAQSSLDILSQAGLSVSATSTMTLEGEDGCEEFPAEELNLALCSDEFAAMADETEFDCRENCSTMLRKLRSSCQLRESPEYLKAYVHKLNGQCNGAEEDEGTDVPTEAPTVSPTLTPTLPPSAAPSKGCIEVPREKLDLLLCADELQVYSDGAATRCSDRCKRMLDSYLTSCTYKEGATGHAQQYIHGLHQMCRLPEPSAPPNTIVPTLQPS
jgi:hypothetical protein